MMKHRNNLQLEISHSSLNKLFTAYQIPLGKETLILFALRGYSPTINPNTNPQANISGWESSFLLAPQVLDYRHMHCTLGIWNRKTGKVFACPGSTVPFGDNVKWAAERKGRLQGKGVNQLEPGFYIDLTKGEHLQGKLNGHAALRQTANRFYRRSLKGIPYDSKDKLYYGNPYDNLHCGWNIDGLAPKYSSAGCLVVAGKPHCQRQEKPEPNQGPWKTFHKFLYTSVQKSFPLLLTEGKMAAQILNAAKSKVNLCYGSDGEVVKILQKKLCDAGVYKGPIHGKLDTRTYKAWNQTGFKV